LLGIKRVSMPFDVVSRHLNLLKLSTSKVSKHVFLMLYLERDAFHAFFAAFFSPAAKSASPSTCTHGDFSIAHFLSTLAASAFSMIQKK
jgi:hypothetical protein